MSLQDEIIDINGNKITDECVCVEHHPDGDTYRTVSPITQPNSYPNLLYYTRLSERNSTVKTRIYTEFKYRIKNNNNK